MAGIIASALAAAGDAGVQSMNQNIAQMSQAALEQQRSDLETAKAKAIIYYQKQASIDAAEQQRQAQVDRINGALPGVAQGQADQTFADHDAALAGVPNSGTPLTPAQQQVLQQTAPTAEVAKSNYKAQLMNDPHSYILAAMSTGDISPTQVAELVKLQDSLKRQEDMQQANFDHSDESQERAQKFAAQQQASQQAATRENIAMTHNLDPMTIETNARAIAAGQMAPLTGNALRSPSGAQTMARVMEINPNYSAKDYGTGAKAEKDFATGKQGNMVRSFNVALSHLDTLSGMADALKNGDVQAINRFGNFISSQMGAPAPTNFDAVKHIVGDEIVKAVTGGAGALGDREAAAKVIDAANSPAQLRGVINSYKELMVGQLHGLRDQYSATTGRNDFDTKYLSDAARAMVGPRSLPPGAGGSHAPASGGVLTYDPATGTFH